MQAPYFQDEDKAREYLESIRWPEGPICPHCGGHEKTYRLEGKSHRKGLLKCGHCRKQFTVTVGTLFERSKIPLHKWLLAAYLLCSSKKGISAHQLHRMLGITYKSIWFLVHRLREAMADPVFTDQLGGAGKYVEADETYWGNKGKQRRGARGAAHKEKIFSLVERGGNVRSFHVSAVSGATLKPILRQQVDRDTHVVTDEMKSYQGLEKDFTAHSTVCHAKGEYARGPIYTNTIENYFSILKRGLTGVYQHCGPQHLRRYVGEFDFRYSNRKFNDVERTILALRGIEGKRLVYRDSSAVCARQ
ncbi:MAG: IS1595 family transposase [Thermodesulfobacteriota bacterium]